MNEQPIVPDGQVSMQDPDGNSFLVAGPAPLGRVKELYADGVLSDSELEEAIEQRLAYQNGSGPYIYQLDGD